jgi:hypothetical protein
MQPDTSIQLTTNNGTVVTLPSKQYSITDATSCLTAMKSFVGEVNDFFNTTMGGASDPYIKARGAVFGGTGMNWNIYGFFH